MLEFSLIKKNLFGSRIIIISSQLVPISIALIALPLNINHLGLGCGEPTV